jgi:hypothetical protein
MKDESADVVIKGKIKAKGATGRTRKAAASAMLLST